MVTQDDTSRSCLARVLRGEAIDGHLMMPLVKQFCAIQAGASFGSYSRDYRVLTRCQLETIERFPIDVFNVLGHPYREAADCGLEVSFPENGQPHAHGVLVERLDDLQRVPWPAPQSGALMNDRLCAIRAFKKARPDVPVMGACESPFAQVNTFMGIERTMMSFFDDPQLLRSALAFVAEHELRFALAQIDAGADMIFIGDSLTSQVGRSKFVEFLLDLDARLVDAIQSRGIPVRWHVCGDCTDILPDLAGITARFLDLDFPVDLSWACDVVQRVSPGSYVVGNFHPVRVLLSGNPEDVRAACRECERQAAGRANFILAPGCEVPPHTPPENYRALIEFGWRYGQGSEPATANAAQ